MSAAVAAALKVVGHCVDTAQFDDGVCQDVVDRLETAGLATLCTTLARLADRYIHHPGAFGHGVGYKVKLWARSKAGKHRGSSSGPRLKARQGVVLFTFALRLAQAAGAGKWRSRAGEATRKEKTVRAASTAVSSVPQSLTCPRIYTYRPAPACVLARAASCVCDACVVESSWRPSGRRRLKGGKRSRGPACDERTSSACSRC